MALIQALLALLTRSAGRMLNMVFAWATVLLFGRVSADRQIYLSAMAFGSVIWLITLLGVAFPGVATFLLSFVVLPAWVDRHWVRAAMLAAVVVVPAIIGALSVRMVDAADRPHGVAAAGRVLKGYPYTVGLAVTLVMMTAFAPILKTRALLRRWKSEHVPVVIESRDYRQVVDAAQAALTAGGVRTQRDRASLMLRAPTKVLTFFARGAVHDLVAEEMAVLRSEDVEILLHPSDIVISGRQARAAHTRAILAKRLVFTPAHLTAGKESQDLEDRLVKIWRARGSQPVSRLLEELDAVEADLDHLELPYAEWETLFREVLLVERGVRRASADWGSNMTAGLSAAAPHLARVIESVEKTTREIRRSGETSRTTQSAGTLAVILATIASIAGLWARRHTRRPPHRPDVEASR